MTSKPPITGVPYSEQVARAYADNWENGEGGSLDIKFRIADRMTRMICDEIDPEFWIQQHFGKFHFPANPECDNEMAQCIQKNIKTIDYWMLDDKHLPFNVGSYIVRSLDDKFYNKHAPFLAHYMFPVECGVEDEGDLHELTVMFSRFVGAFQPKLIDMLPNGFDDDSIADLLSITSETAKIRSLLRMIEAQANSEVSRKKLKAVS
jgi:hypothetical protein